MIREFDDAYFQACEDAETAKEPLTSPAWAMARRAKCGLVTELADVERLERELKTVKP